MAIKLILLYAGLFLTISVQAQESKVLSSMSLRLLKLSDLKLELNEFQEDCLNLLKNPLVKKAQVDILQHTDADVYSLRVSGVSPKSTQVLLPQQKWLFVKKSGEEVDFTPDIAKKVVPDNLGFFQFTIQVPQVVSAQIPIEFRDRASQSYYLLLNIQDGRILEAKLKPYFRKDQRKLFCTKSRGTGSLGATAFLYKQSFSAVSGDANYVSFKFPSYSFGVDWSQNPESDQSVWYRSAPGTVRLPESLGSSLNYNWNILDYHYSYGDKRWISEVFGDLFYPRIRLGFQMHQLPVVQLKSAQDVQVSPISMTNLAVGFNGKMYSAKHWMVEFQIGAQYPLSASEKIKYKSMFDGGIGISAAYWPNTFVGLQWYGHSHTFQYNRPNSFDAKGEINFLYSSIEASVGMLF